MKTNIELAAQAGMSIGLTEASPYPTEECINRLLELHRAQVIAGLAAVEGGPVAFRTRYRSEPGMIGNYPWSYAEITRMRHALRPEYEHEHLYTDTQLAAHRARDLAEIDRLTAVSGGYANENLRLQARVSELEKDAERLDWIQWRLFTNKWNGVVGSGCATQWSIAPDYRHVVANIRTGDIEIDFRAAIDAARAKEAQ